MRNTMKVAKWEIKRNLKNKTFLIGLFLTPVLIIGFMLLGSLFGDDPADTEQETTRVFVNDQLGVFPELQESVNQNKLPWDLLQTDLSEKEVAAEAELSENTAYIFIDERAMQEGNVPVYLSEEIPPFFSNELQLLSSPLQTMQMEELGITEKQLAVISKGFHFNEQSPGENINTTSTEEETSLGENPIEDLAPGAFAGFIMLSIVFTGMAIFQSASQEKKDKIAEIILSSLTPAELMQGKIIGYFVLGLIQAVVSITLLFPFLLWKIDLPIIEYIFVPELILLLVIAILGFLLFASLFVGIGATMADITTAGNFQGMVMMLPFLPFIFIGPVISDPTGLMAQIGTYIPFTSPGVLLLRLTIMEEWPWVEIVISLAILIVSVWLAMKLAGKIFKVGILMYGKNATPGEIWKWIRA
ncbi:ABC transporter permease [Virgibacillus halodenitrificans]|uniref:ABC transporter permease n=1 Tax=Virgibacillus halodenitrificans TaxID=1482 RepID=UPI000EF55A2A|nr:ABC transporter permease [Virgibacillus halodenitrificans]